VTDCYSEYPGASEHGGKGEIPLQLTLPERFAQVVSGLYRSEYPYVGYLDVYETVGIRTIL
jgi:hypothetical protein